MNHNLTKHFRVAYLVSAELMNTLTSDERKELVDWKCASSSNLEDYNDLKDYLLSHPEEWSHGVENQHLVDEEWRKFSKQYVEKEHLYLKKFLRYAAIFILPAVLGIFLWLHLTDTVLENDVVITPGDRKSVV